MTENLIGSQVKHAARWSGLIALLMIIAGVAAIFAPMAAGVVVVLVVSWAAVFTGAAHLFYAFSTHHGGHMLLEILLGMLYIGCGTFVLLHPGGGLLAFTLLLAVFLMLYGGFGIFLALQLRIFSAWRWVLFDAIVTFFLGMLVWAHWPSSSEWVLGTLLGISFLTSGISRLMFSLTIRRFATAAL